MQEQVIGILGGMGPEATLNCFDKIIRNTPALNDQDHLKVIIVNNPKIPDRTRAVLDSGPSPLPMLIDGCASLQKAGADFIIIPCVTVHYFIEPLKDASRLPVISILDAVAEAIGRHDPRLGTIGLLGTDGTVQSGIFQKRLARAGLDTITCEEAVQQAAMAAIYDIKRDRPSRNRQEITRELTTAARHLIDRGAQGIIAGCTEIPLVLTQSEVAVPYFDSLSILARAAIRRAGREPVTVSSARSMVSTGNKSE
ncbi:MAG: aspartate racemase [Deltaproteobacteria bacterium]|nr:MAG: aspartate racemase [Deltaproteobacteria bacterium]